jgi:predicted MPP superfamily phosphohydrolase
VPHEGQRGFNARPQGEATKPRRTESVRSWRRTAYTIGALTAAGLVLLAVILHSSFLWIPSSWMAAGDLLFRVAFFIILPFRGVATFLFPPHGHHWTLMHHAFAAISAPFFYYGIWRLFLLMRKKWLALRRWDPAIHADSLSRRQFLSRSASGVVGVAGSGFVGYVSIISPQKIAVRRYRMPIAGLPKDLDGLRITHISDTHYGPYVPKHFLEDVIGAANGLGGDVMLLTGDYVHYTPEAVPTGVALLANLKAPLGCAAVLGNHDHWEGTDACIKAFSKTNINLIDNNRLFLSPEGFTSRATSDSAVCVAGMGDLWTDKISFYKALSGIPDEMPRLLLSHNPDVAELLDGRYRVDMMLSGHTHGGQIALPGVSAIAPTRFGDRYLGGVCQGPQCPVVVSRGIGVAVVPVRFRVPPELVTIDLEQA